MSPESQSQLIVTIAWIIVGAGSAFLIVAAIWNLRSRFADSDERPALERSKQVRGVSKRARR
jgi:hypothetical protein